MSAPAVQRRFDAIGNVSRAVVNYVPELRENVWEFTADQRDAVAVLIRDIAPLGRTDRWQGAVERWARAVENAESDQQFQHSFFQFGIYASHAAE